RAAPGWSTTSPPTRAPASCQGTGGPVGPRRTTAGLLDSADRPVHAVGALPHGSRRTDLSPPRRTTAFRDVPVRPRGQEIEDVPGVAVVGCVRGCPWANIALCVCPQMLPACPVGGNVVGRRHLPMSPR